MPELKIPDQLEPDCDNCQGMCCMAMAHRVVDGFPLEEDKPNGVPCLNLETNPLNVESLYKCRIYETRAHEGWRQCESFSCYGAGQTISQFFKELGVSWAIKSNDLKEDQNKIMIENLNLGFQVMYMVLSHLDAIGHTFDPLREKKVIAAKVAASKIALQFSEHLTANKKVDVAFWYSKNFLPAMASAEAEVSEKAIMDYVRRGLSIFRFSK